MNEPLLDRIAHLERTLAARERTLSVLADRAEAAQTGDVSAFALVKQSAALERVVRAKTAALDEAFAALRATELQLLAAHKMEAIGQLSAGIAHEINTPAQFVGDNITFLARAFKPLEALADHCRNLVDTLGRGTVTPKQLEVTKTAIRKARLDILLDEIPRSLEQAAEGLVRISTIVRAMKEFSHPSGGQKLPVNLNESILTTLTVARSEWRYVTEVETELDPDLPLAPCVRDEVNQVILNLIVNAAHAMSDRLAADDRPRLIVISTHKRPDAVELRVRDTGCGIPEAVQGRMFEPFFTTKGVGRGTGQGLAIAHAVIVEKHGGTITCESTLGVGTTFIVTLPLQTPDTTAH